MLSDVQSHPINQVCGNIEDNLSTMRMRMVKMVMMMILIMMMVMVMVMVMMMMVQTAQPVL